ncbi:MAG: hypothetical protein GEU90_20105 [Gemmatimonas sp.]|nr:hypothetical protein [Gemmatimonas sp.]
MVRSYRYGLHGARYHGPAEPRRGRELRHHAVPLRGRLQRRVEQLPFFDSGTAIVTGLQEGLFILKKRGQDAEVVS